MQLIHFNNIDSTSKYLKDNYDTLENFTVISAGFQTNGKGREDRTWLSNEGENLLFSILIKDKEIVTKFNGVSMLVASSIRRYLEKSGVKNATVKWPNDVYVNDKKICGILLEGRYPDYLVVGVGFNLNQTEFVGDYHVEPTSLALEKHVKFENNWVLRWILEEIEQEITGFKEGTYSPLFDLRTHNYLINKEVKYIDHGEEKLGRVLGINDDFTLKIFDGKNIKYISSGEIDLSI